MTDDLSATRLLIERRMGLLDACDVVLRLAEGVPTDTVRVRALLDASAAIRVAMPPLLADPRVAP